MGLDEATGIGKTQSRTSAGSLVREEGLERMLQCSLGKTGAGVGDLDAEPALEQSHIEGH